MPVTRDAGGPGPGGTLGTGDRGTGGPGTSALTVPGADATIPPPSPPAAAGMPPTSPGLSRQVARWGNAWRRLRHGLPARGSRVSPEVANDLFLAHLAVYDFAGRLAGGRRVLDLGCGTGYGSAHLLAAGAASVVGLDPDAARDRKSVV